ncbi:MAG: hypothetical protein WCP68_01575 [Enhydrobacter sp.]
MRTLKLLAAAALAASTAACVETVDQGYGYSDGYYAPSQSYAGQGYYAQPSYYSPAPTYYAPTQVVTQTRYVPVPVAVPQHTFTPHASTPKAGRGNDHRDRPQANNTPPATHQPPANPQPGNTQHRGNGNGRDHDRDGDGRPDRRS